MTLRQFVLTDTKHVYDRLNALLMHCGINPKWVQNEAQLSNELTADEFAVVFMSTTEQRDVYVTCENVSSQFTNTTVVLIGEERHVDMKKALRSGVADVIFIDAPAQQLEADIQAVKARIEVKRNQVSQTISGVKPAEKRAKIMTVCSTKGGVGKTTFAVNLATALAKQQKVAVVDLNLQFGDIALFFDCKPRKTIYDWVKEEEHRSSQNLASYLYPYNKHLHILSAPQRPEFAEVITGQHVKMILQKLKQNYDVIILDTGSQMDEIVLVSLEEAEDIFVMTHLDLPTLKNSHVLLETLSSLGLKHKAKVILNREKKTKGLSRHMAEQVLGVPFFARIPVTEKVAVSSMNEGKPYVISHPRSKAAKSIFAVIHKLEATRARFTSTRVKANRVVHVGGNA